MSQAVQQMFSSIADGYDRANSVLSMGVHHIWRRKALKVLAPQPGERILDVCSGTGDVAFALQPKLEPGGLIHGADFCIPMLQQTKNKSREPGKTVFVGADAQKLPYRDDTFDGATVSFGIRNVDDPVKGLREMCRVVRPGGRVVVLEFGQPSLPVFSSFYRFYSKHVMPRLGAWVTGVRSAYEYLPETAAAFPCGEKFLDWMLEAGLSSPSSRSLSLGIAYLYRGEVPVQGEASEKPERSGS